MAARVIVTPRQLALNLIGSVELYRVLPKNALVEKGIARLNIHGALAEAIRCHKEDPSMFSHDVVWQKILPRLALLSSQDALVNDTDAVVGTLGSLSLQDLFKEGKGPLRPIDPAWIRSNNPFAAYACK